MDVAKVQWNLLSRSFERKVERKVFPEGLFKVHSRDGHCQMWTGFQGVFASLHFYFPHYRLFELTEIQWKARVLATQSE